MELNARLLSNTWFYSQDYQDELEFVAFGGRDEQDELQKERSDPFIGWDSDQLRDSLLNWQAEVKRSQLRDQLVEIFPEKLEADSCTPNSSEDFSDNFCDNLNDNFSNNFNDNFGNKFSNNFSNNSSTNSSNNSNDNFDNNSSNSSNFNDNPSDSMMEENYSDCFFSQCNDPFESLLSLKDEDFIEIDVERSASPPSIHEEVHDVKPFIERTDSERYSAERYSAERYSTERYSTERYSAERYSTERGDRSYKKQMLRKTQKMIEKSKRGRPQNSRPISQKAQISKDWREKKKMQDQQLQEKVCKLEVENGQLCKQNTKMKDEIRELRKMVAKLQKRTA